MHLYTKGVEYLKQISTETSSTTLAWQVDKALFLTFSVGVHKCTYSHYFYECVHVEFAHVYGLCGVLESLRMAAGAGCWGWGTDFARQTGVVVFITLQNGVRHPRWQFAWQSSLHIATVLLLLYQSRFRCWARDQWAPWSFSGRSSPYVFRLDSTPVAKNVGLISEWQLARSSSQKFSKCFWLESASADPKIFPVGVWVKSQKCLNVIWNSQPVFFSTGQKRLGRPPYIGELGTYGVYMD